jgi:hypothetical protein
VVRLPVLLQNCFFSEGGGYELNLPTTVPADAAFSRFPCKAGQQVDQSHCLDRLLRSRAVPIISVTLAARRATSSSMHPTDAAAAYRRRSTTLPCSFRFGVAARRVVGALHGVDGHFDLVPPPTPTRSGSLASSRIGIGISGLAATRAGLAVVRPAPVVTLSAMIA